MWPEKDPVKWQRTELRYNKQFVRPRPFPYLNVLLAAIALILWLLVLLAFL
jgi:hypothetical protein